MTKQFRGLLYLVALLAFATPVVADVRLPKILGDSMVLQREKPINIWGWADPDEAVVVTFGDVSATAVTGKDGKWSVQLPAQKANAEAAELKVQGKNEIVLKDILVGEVWLCSGQSNMRWSMTRSEFQGEDIPAAKHPNIRLFAIKERRSGKPEEDTPHNWTACTPQTVADFSGVGYNFGKRLQSELKIPIGLIRCAWGGTQIEPWTPTVGLEQVESLKPTGDQGNGQIYNGMVHPLAPLTMRGIIWYQGESNCLKGDTDIYTDRTIAMVKGWRTVFKQDDLSFYFVQIAPFNYVKAFKGRNKSLTELSLPKFWDAQTACLKELPNCGMVVITDFTGNTGDIHPPNKRVPGQRLAGWALAKNYGRDDLVYSGPLYKSLKVDGNKAIVSFDHAAGLKSGDGQPLAQFTIAGEDKKFVPATATVEGDTIVVSNSEVATPVAVRYAYHETAIGNLANGADLPAVPFRTDRW